MDWEIWDWILAIRKLDIPIGPSDKVTITDFTVYAWSTVWDQSAMVVDQSDNFDTAFSQVFFINFTYTIVNLLLG